MDESPLIDCTAAGSFEIVVSCPVFEAILLPYRLTSFRVSERLKRPLASMCTVPYQSNTNPYSNFLSREACASGLAVLSLRSHTLCCVLHFCRIMSRNSATGLATVELLCDLTLTLLRYNCSPLLGDGRCGSHVENATFSLSDVQKKSKISGRE